MDLWLNNVIIEGVDRLGKNTLITNLQHHLGFFQEIHFEKPKLLDCYFDRHSSKAEALKEYQLDSFKYVLAGLTHKTRFILNRSHLGEAVYAHRYRGYDGSYVFDLERELIDHGNVFHRSTLLVTLMTSDFSFIADDGLSFDFTKKEEEQADFLKAHERSAIMHKLLIDVNDGGQFLNPNEIAYRVFEKMQ